MLITLITALLSFLNPYTRMGGTELVYNLFAECRPDNNHGGLCVAKREHIAPVIRAIAVALLVKGGLTIVTFGIKLPAGIFIPTLGVGACAGRILGLCVQWLSLTNPNLWIFDSCGSKNTQCVVPGVYAMVGAAATLSGVTVRLLVVVIRQPQLTRQLAHNCIPCSYHVRTYGDFNLRRPSHVVCPCCQDGRGCVGTKGCLRLGHRVGPLLFTPISG